MIVFLDVYLYIMTHEDWPDTRE